MVTKKKKDIDRNSLNTTEFYSINTDSSIIRLDSRLTLSYKDYSEVIDLSSKQKFIQALDTEFNDFKTKKREQNCWPMLQNELDERGRLVGW